MIFKSKNIVYLLIIGVTASIIGGGFFWYASSFNPKMSDIKITYQKPIILGEEEVIPEVNESDNEDLNQEPKNNNRSIKQISEQKSESQQTIISPSNTNENINTNSQPLNSNTNTNTNIPTNVNNNPINSNTNTSLPNNNINTNGNTNANTNAPVYEPEPMPDPATVTLTATPEATDTGETVLSWTSTNAAKLVIKKGTGEDTVLIGEVAVPSGQMNITVEENNTYYQITATNSRGWGMTAGVTIYTPTHHEDYPIFLSIEV